MSGHARSPVRKQAKPAAASQKPGQQPAKQPPQPPSSVSPAAHSGHPLAVHEIPLDEIDLEEKPYQYRLETKLEALKASLERDGQREPVDLIGPPYQIVDGYCRIEALKELSAKVVKALVHELDEEEAHTLAFVKNVVRKNLTPLEKGHAIQLARQRGKSHEDIAKSLGLSVKQVQRYESLVKFPPAILRLVETKKTSMAHAAVLAAFSLEEPGEWALKAARNHWSPAQLRKEIKKARGHKSPGRPKKYFTADGTTLRLYQTKIRKDAPKADREQMVEALKEMIEWLEG